MAVALFYEASHLHCMRRDIEIPPKLHKSKKEGTGMWYCEAENYPLDIYNTDHVVTETNANMKRFNQQ